jgi:hypothetical protein
MNDDDDDDDDDCNNKFRMEIGTYGVLTVFIYKDGYGSYSDYHTASRGFIQFLYTGVIKCFTWQANMKSLTFITKAIWT